MIVAVPSPAPRTSPDALTVATAAVLLAQVTVAPVITWPFWSRTCTVSWTVAPSAANSAVAGLTVTVVGLGASGEGSVAPSQQPAATRSGARAARDKTGFKRDWRGSGFREWDGVM